MNKYYLPVLLGLAFFGISAACLMSDETPRLIDYRGKLTDDAGDPFALDREITFAIYTQPEGGTAVWSEPQTVTVIDGAFHTLLGTVSPINPDLFSLYGATYLGVKVGTDSEMNPRQEFASVAYAMKTEGISVREGNIGIGTMTPATELEVDGVISAENADPIRKQLVHQRVLFGYTGDADLAYGNSWTTVRNSYGPFRYAVPALQPGAVRKFRLYAIYSDTMNSGENQVWFETQNIVLTLPLTWGGTGGYNRDGYSDWHTSDPGSAHSNIKIRTTQSGSSGVLHYLVIQAWDFF